METNDGKYEAKLYQNSQDKSKLTIYVFDEHKGDPVAQFDMVDLFLENINSSSCYTDEKDLIVELLEKILSILYLARLKGKNADLYHTALNALIKIGCIASPPGSEK